MENYFGIALIALLFMALFIMLVGILRSEPNQFTDDKPESAKIEQPEE